MRNYFNNQKGIAPIVMILIIVGVLVIGGGVWYFQNQKGIKYYSVHEEWKNDCLKQNGTPLLIEHITDYIDCATKNGLILRLKGEEKNKFNYKDFPELTKETSICATEGETIGAQGMPLICCPGLKPVGGWPGGYQGDCSIPPPPTGLNICANCGNKICESNNGENKCNCPEDCF